MPWCVRASAGFSLAEVLIAMAIFALGFAGIGGMQMTAMKLNARAYGTTQLATIVQEQMEHLLTVPMSAAGLQDTLPEPGQGTTYCVLYPPEGIRPCRDPSFVSAYPATGPRPYCVVTTQGQGETACADGSFPPPTAGYKVLWTVDRDQRGNADPQAIPLAYIDLTVSQKFAGKYTATPARQTPHDKTYQMSFARFSR